MVTRVYGASDDLIEFRGNVEGEVGFYGEDKPALVMCSDGTILEVRYGKGSLGIWAITLVSQGSLYNGIVQCVDEDADPYSDVAHFRDGLNWAYVAKQWERVK